MVAFDRGALPWTGVLFGAAYYAEYQPEDRLETDLELMVEAGFSVIRVGESVWSTWEPRDGEFDVEWLRPVLDAAHRKGIAVVLGTPTYAVPPWLQVKHPELAAVTETGACVPWGARQEVDYSSPLFRRYAERVVRKVLERYADHPAVIGFQVDNEPGLRLLHNRHTFEAFKRRLRDRYGSPEALNREWGLVYWSHRIADFDELWMPGGNSSPQYDLAWRRFQADVTGDFIAWQASIVREYSSGSQFVTTCLAYPRPAVHDEQVTRELDVTAGNPYYRMQDGLELGRDVPNLQPWTTTGVAGLLRQADRLYSSKQARYLVTETDAQSVSGPDKNYPPYPGQLVQAGLAFVARGAAMVEYWHWHTLHFGFETYWGGVLPHSLRPGRVYREVSRLGSILGRVGPELDGFVPDADVAMLHSTESRWAMQFFPPLFDEARQPDRASYERIFDAHYRGFVESGLQVRIFHDAQLVERDPEAFVREHPVLVAAGFYVAGDDALAWLHRYVHGGGHLVLGIRTGYADQEARARATPAPPSFADSARVWYEEYSNLDGPVAVTAEDGLPPVDGMAGTGWADGLVPTGATTLAHYVHPELGRFAAVTTTAVGAGRVSCVGTVPNPALARSLARWLNPAPLSSAVVAESSSSVTVHSGVNASGRRVYFVHNWSGADGRVRLSAPLLDLVTGDQATAGAELALGAWGVLVLAETL